MIASRWVDPWIASRADVSLFIFYLFFFVLARTNFFFLIIIIFYSFFFLTHPQGRKNTKSHFPPLSGWLKGNGDLPSLSLPLIQSFKHNSR